MEENQKNNQKEKEAKLNDKLKKQVEEQIQQIIDEGVQESNVNLLYRLVDIHKDLENEDYWSVKKEGMEMMRYNEYDDYYPNYSKRGMPGTGRGRYGDGSYGRRGVPGSGRGRYRGDYAIDEMRDHYMNYSDANEETMRGNYGAEGEMIKSVEGIMKNIYEIVEELSETNSPDVEQIIKKYARKISEM